MMKTKDFLKERFNVDVADFSQVENSEIRNQMIFDGLNCPDVFEKDINDLTEEEIFSLFVKRYMQPGNGPWFFNDIVEKGKEEIERIYATMKKLIFSLFMAFVATTALWASNVISYTAAEKLPEVTTDGWAIGLHTNAFNVAITSHEFSNGTGTITFAGEVTIIGYEAFTVCKGLTSITIPNSVTTIGEGAFSGCRGLTSVTIPNSVTTIGDWAFGYVNNIVYNGIATGSPWGAKCVNGYVDGYLVYSDATKTTLCGCSTAATGEITIPNSVTTIGERAFNGCTGLASVTIPNSVTTIGGGAFGDCTGLTSVTIPNSITTIGEAAFVRCSGLTSVTIPNSVTTIGGEAFGDCTGLTSVTIPNSVTTIGGGAFYGCKGLTSVTIPNSVTSIGESAFDNCFGLTKTNYTGTISQWCKIEFNNKSSNPIFYSLNFFINDVEVKNLVIPNSVTEIGDYTFCGCSGLTSVTIPNSVTSIGDYTFYNCTSLTSVTIPNSVTTIGEHAFNGCTGLASVTIPNSITTIGEAAFVRCSGLTSVTIPNSVTTIGEYAFYYCTSLTSITCYAQNPPICGSYCFYDVPKNIPLYVPYVSLDAYKSAEGWKDFTNIITKYFDICGEDLRWKYEEGTLSISGTGEMSNFTQTDSPWLDLKDSVTNIVFPSNITSIGKYAFYGFSKLTSETTPNAITTIGESAFEDCTYLKTITLGKSLTDIGYNAFKGDFRIEEITSYAEVTPNVCSSTFDGLSKQYIYLYVPENSIRSYQVDPNWNGFDIRTKSADKKPIDGDNPIVTPTDQDVTITWPITDGTDTYTLTITKNGEVVCVLTFNAQGQLTNIAFAAPDHNGARQAPAATLTAQGYQFTVTGLNPGTAYNYSVTATDAGGQTLAEHKGNFSTTGGGTPTSIDEAHGSQPTMHKVLRNGQLLIETNNATYTLMGQKVR